MVFYFSYSKNFLSVGDARNFPGMEKEKERRKGEGIKVEESQTTKRFQIWKITGGELLSMWHNAKNFQGQPFIQLLHSLKNHTEDDGSLHCASGVYTKSTCIWNYFSFVCQTNTCVWICLKQSLPIGIPVFLSTGIKLKIVLASPGFICKLVFVMF